MYFVASTADDQVPVYNLFIWPNILQARKGDGGNTSPLRAFLLVLGWLISSTHKEEAGLMINSKTLRNIRMKHNLSQEEFANKLGYPAAYIRSLEDTTGEREQAAPEFIANLRDKFNLHGIPITDEEKTTFYERLITLANCIDYGYADKAAEAIPDLTRCAKASCHSSFMILCDLYTAYYNLETGDYKAFDKIIASLEQQKQSFDARHHHYFNRFIGQRMYYAGNYGKALEAYAKAKELDKYAHMRNVNFYFFYGMILSDMGYATKAAKYFKEAAHHARWNKSFNERPNNRYDVYIDGYLADNLSKIGQSEEALTILNKRLEKETKKESPNDTIGYIYLSFGTVCLRTEQYHKALEHFETATRYLDERSEAYKTNLQRKALALIASGNISEGVACADKGLNITHLNDLWKTLFEAIKHSASLSDPASQGYMKSTVIPKLLNYKMYEEVLSGYKALSNFFSEDGNYESALKYSELAIKIHEKLFKELVEGGL